MNLKIFRYVTILLMSMIFILNPVKADVNVVDRPENGIYDPNHHLSQSTIDKVKTFNEMNDSQFDIYITDNLYDVSIDELSSTLSKYWEVGSHSGTGNRFVLAISTGDKKIELQPSISASYYVDEDQADRILDKSIEYLKSEDYDSAVVSMIDQLNYVIAKKHDEDLASSNNLVQDDSVSQNSNLAFFNSDEYRGAFYMFSALIIGVFIFPIGIFIIAFLVIIHQIKRKNIGSDTAVAETEEQTSSNHIEVKESSHFDSPFE